MGTRAEVQEPPISPQIFPNEAVQNLSALSPTAGGSPNTDKEALQSCSPTTSLGSGKDPLPDPIEQPESKCKDAVHASAASSVEGGLEDASSDPCSICWAPFCESNLATVTTCKHFYHLTCILEWAKRSKECPMCSRDLSFEDPNSQKLFDAIDRKRSLLRGSHSRFHSRPVTFANYADFEERIGIVLSMYEEPYVHSADPALLRPSRAFLEQPLQEANNEPEVHESERNEVSETVEESQQRIMNWDISSLSVSLKSCFIVASSKWKETFTKTTHGFKERWRARSPRDQS